MENEVEGSTQVAEPTQEQLNSDLFGQEAPAQQQQASQGQPDIQKQINEAIQQAMQQHLNPIRAEFGKFRQIQSEWDKTKNQQANQPAPEWASLDEAARKQTRAIIKAAWDEEYGKDWTSMRQEREEFNSERQKWQSITAVQRIAGADWNDDFDEKAGDIIKKAMQDANNGDENASQFLKEFNETRAGKQVLVDMVRAQIRGSMTAQSQQAQNQQAQARKSASTAVSRPGQTNAPSNIDSVSKIRDPKERLKVLQSMMDTDQG